MKFLMKIYLALMLAALSGVPAFPAEAGKTIRVGFFHFEGYHEQSPDGKMSGYGYEYLQNLRKYTGWNFEYVGYEKSWAEMLDMLERGEIDLLSSVTKTPERAEKFEFSAGPIGNAAVLMTVKAGNRHYLPGDYRNWNGIRVGFMRNNTKNDIFDDFARQKGFRYIPVMFDDDTQMQHALQKGDRIDALVIGSLRRLKNEWVFEQIDPQPFYIVARKGDKTLIGELNNALEQLQIDQPSLADRLQRKYYSNIAKDEVLFSAQERVFIQEANLSGRVFRVLVNPDRPPFSSFQDGKLHGVFKDIADRISKRSGLTFEFIPTASREEYGKALSESDVDLVFDLRHDFQNAEKLGYILTDPYFSAVISRLHRRSFSGKPQSVALVRNSDVAATAMAYGLEGAVPVFYNSNLEVIEAVKSGRQDTGVVYTRTAEKAIADDGFSNLTYDVIGGLNTPYAIGIKSDRDLRLISILDKTVRSFSKSDIDRIVMTTMIIPPRSLSMLDLLMANPVRSFGILGLILLAVMVFFGWFWMMNRKLWRYGKIAAKLPLHFFVIDAEENVLISSAGNERRANHSSLLGNYSDPAEDRIRRLVVEKIHEVIQTGKSCTVDFDFKGGKRTAEVMPLPENIFRRPTAIWVSMDTTELQAAREEALFNAERFRLTLQAIGDGVMVTDEEGRITMLNQVAEHLTGCRTAEAVGKRHEDIFDIRNSLDGAPVISPVREALKNGRIVTLANHTDLICPDGSRRHIADSAAPIRDRENKIIGAILVFRDVTAEYANRDHLRETLMSLEYATELTDSAAFLFDPATRKMTGSKLLPKLWEISDDGGATSIRRWIYREDRRKVFGAWKELAKGKTKVMTVEYRSDRSGEMRHYRMRASADRSNAQFPQFLGVIQDVTEIVQSAGQLKAQQALWEKVINAIPVMFFAKNADDSFRYILCNRAFADFIGRPPEEVIGKTDGELFSVPEETESFLNKDRAIMAKSEGETFEEDATDSKGISHYIRTVKQPFVMPNGVRLLLGTSNDISELNRLIISEQINSKVLTRAVAEDDFERVIENVTETMQEYTNCDRIILTRCNEEGKLRVYREWRWGDVHPLVDTELENHYQLWDKYLHIMQENRTVIIPDFFNHQFAAGLGRDDKYHTASLAITPIFIDGRLWGSLFASYSFQKHGFTESDERLMRSCANVIAMAEIRNRQKRTIERATLERQIIFNNVRIPLWLHDGEGELLQVNNAVCKLAGIPAEKFTTRGNREIFCANMTDYPVAEAIKTGHSIRREIPFRDREYIVNVEPIFSEEGKLIYIIKSAVDVTEINALLKNQQVVNFCLETLLGNGDMEQAILQALEAVCRHLGASRSYILRFDSAAKMMNCFVEYITPGRPPIFSNIKDHPYSAVPTWEERFRENPDIIIEDMQNASISEFGDKWLEDIRKFHVQSVFAKRLMLDSKVWGYLGMVFEDKPHRFSKYDNQFISSVAHFVELMLERSRAQQQILNALQETREASKAKSYFLASMSHEIRTPLNSVIGFSDLLLDDKLPPAEQKNYIASINFAGNALLELINDVLDLSKLEAGQMVFTPQETDFVALAVEVMHIFEPKLLQKKLSAENLIGELPKIFIDKLRLRQILFNLIGNAVKFTERGQVTLAAEFHPENDRTGTLVFSVSDTGCGISEEDRKGLFEAFVQCKAQRGTRAANQGTGLGLAIIKQMLTQMDGTIELDSELGTGSTFTVKIHNIPYDAAKKPSGLPAAAATGNPDGPPAIKSALVVDDVTLNLRVLGAMLTRLGVTANLASSAAEALAYLKDHQVDMVLTDIWMPDTNGDELAKILKSNPQTAGLPVIAVTADSESVANFRERNFDDVLLKPITLDRLRALICSRKPE